MERKKKVIKRKINEREVNYLVDQVEAIKLIPTWTKAKHAAKEELFDFIMKNYVSYTCQMYREFKNLKQERYYTWEYGLRTISPRQNGGLKPLRNTKVFIMCLKIYSPGGEREFLVLPIGEK